MEIYNLTPSTEGKKTLGNYYEYARSRCLMLLVFECMPCYQPPDIFMNYMIFRIQADTNQYENQIQKNSQKDKGEAASMQLTEHYAHENQHGQGQLCMSHLPISIQPPLGQG